MGSPLPNVDNARMRLLHTSDWHLGQAFFGHDRSAEQQLFLDWLLDTLEAEAVDALLIAGDLYDQAHPAAETQRQFHAFLGNARRLLPQLQIIAIAGNHDSPARLDATTPLLRALDIQLIGPVPDDPAQLLLPLRERDGAIAAWCLAVPYLRPADLALRPDAHADAAGPPYGRAVLDYYSRLHILAQARRQPGQALIAMGHLHLSGGCDTPASERRLVVGGAEAVDAGPLAALADYVALGHLHLAQTVGAEHVRYSGSPLPLSFTEIGYPHQVLRVDLAAGRLTGILPLPVPRPVALLRVPAQPGPVDQVLAELAALPTDPDLPAALRPFLEVLVALAEPQPGLSHRIHQLLADKAVRLTRIQRQVGLDPARTPALLSDLEQLSPQQLLARHYAQRYGQSLPEALALALAEIERAVDLP